MKQSMKTRLITSAVGIVLCVIILVMHQSILFPLAVSVIALMLVYEMLRATDLLKHDLLTDTIVMGFAFFYPLLCNTKYAPLVCFLFFGGLCLNFIINHSSFHPDEFFMLIGIMFALPFSMSCGVKMEAMDTKFGIMYVLMALGGSWLADSGAYFVGSSLGKGKNNKLCPHISPNKTVEGFVGGILTNGIIFLFFNIIYLSVINSHAAEGVHYSANLFFIFMIGCISAVIGTFGDLTASVIKRQYGIKDYGTIMPGHGGMMDRFDSVLLVLPFTYAIVSLHPIYVLAG